MKLAKHSVEHRETTEIGGGALISTSKRHVKWIF